MRPRPKSQVKGATRTCLYDPTPARSPNFPRWNFIHVEISDLGRGCGHVGLSRGWEGATHLPHATSQLGGRVNPRLLGHKTQLGGRVDFTVLLVGGQVYTRHPSARWCSVCPVLAIDHTCHTLLADTVSSSVRKRVVWGSDCTSLHQLRQPLVHMRTC